MSANRISAEASKASAEKGIVLVDGPDGVAMSMTPDAAELTGTRLHDAAALARTQRADPPDDETDQPST